MRLFYLHKLLLLFFGFSSMPFGKEKHLAAEDSLAKVTKTRGVRARYMS